MLICAHYNPACSEFWKIPAELLVPVLIPKAKYDTLRRDVFDRIQSNPIDNTSRVRFSEPLAPDQGYSEVLSWMLREFPLDDVEIRAKLEQERRSLAEGAHHDYSALKGLPRHYAATVHHLATGEPCFNPEYAPSQTMFSENLLEKHAVYPMYCGSKVVYLLSAEKNNFAFEDEWLSSGNEAIDFRTIYADRDTIMAIIAKERGRVAAAGSVEVSAISRIPMSQTSLRSTCRRCSASTRRASMSPRSRWSTGCFTGRSPDGRATCTSRSISTRRASAPASTVR